MKTCALAPGPMLFLSIVTIVLVAQQPGSSAAAALMKALAVKCDDAKQYSWEGEILVEGKKANTPWQPLSQAKVKLAVADKGRSYLRVEPPQQDEYWLVSNGQKSWAYLPQRKQYSSLLRRSALARQPEDAQVRSCHSRECAGQKSPGA